VQPSRRLKAFLLGLAVSLTILVGASRVYLGVHWMVMIDAAAP
jgi:undecaprenyl-diphosphatase